MRFISTIAHGLADYLVGLAVVSMPFYLGWTGSARVIFVTLGVVAICYSLLTDMNSACSGHRRYHLLLDVFGIAMLAAPMLLHLPTGNSTIVEVIGALSVLLSFTTKIRAHGTGSEAVASGIMKALCWHGEGDIRCDNVPDPKIEHGREAVIKMMACALCGSDCT